MNSLQTQIQPQHSSYEPFKWIYGVRIAQLILSVLVMILCAYWASQYWMTVPVVFSFWVASWSIIYVPIVTWVMPRVRAKTRPNIIVTVLEGFSWFWWFLTFIFMTLYVSGIWVHGLLVGIPSYGAVYDPSYDYRLVKRTPKYEIPSSSSEGINSADNAVSNVVSAWGAIKAATIFAAINWALFVATFIAIGIKIYRQRRARLQGAGASGGVNEGHGVAVESDKGPQVTTNSVSA